MCVLSGENKAGSGSRKYASGGEEKLEGAILFVLFFILKNLFKYKSLYFYFMF